MPDIGRYLFDRFELYPLERRLLCDTKPVFLGDRAFEILVKLLEHPGRTLSKRELLEWVWPNVIVGENNLQKQMCALRRVLGGGIIATIPRYGYRLTTQVRCEAAEAAGTTTVEAHSLARALADPSTSFLLVVIDHGVSPFESVDDLISAVQAVRPGIRILSTDRGKLPRTPE